MGLGDLNIIDNLVYGLFGEPILFALIVSMIFLYYSIKYDIPKWVNIAFFIPFGIWIGFYYMPDWIVVSIIIAIGLIVSPRLFRFSRA